MQFCSQSKATPWKGAPFSTGNDIPWKYKLDNFNYIDGALFVEDVPVESLIHRYGSPLYVYSESTLVRHFATLKGAFAAIDPLICFSVKSCSNLSVLKLLVERGSGLDVVSGGELFRALKAGVTADKVVFAGVGKSKDEIRYAIEAGVFLFNVESEAELQRIDAIASALNKRIKAAIRVNPDVADAGTHAKTATGGRQTKFGIPICRSPELFTPGRYRNVDVVGIHIHLGSPIPSASTYLAAIDRVEQLIEQVESHGGQVEFVNIGGGFPATYNTETHPSSPLVETSAAICARLQSLKARGKTFIIEPGRSISANSGILLTTVEYMKNGWDRSIAVVDAGMNTLLRPTLYGASHVIWPTGFDRFSGHWSELSGVETSRFDKIDIVGPICETGDHFALGRQLPTPREGDVLAIFSSGAYGMSMASQYNSRGRPAEVVVSGKQARLVRKRESYDDLISHEIDGLDTEIVFRPGAV